MHGYAAMQQCSQQQQQHALGASARLSAEAAPDLWWFSQQMQDEAVGSTFPYLTEACRKPQARR
jgi:hypothetical protein